MPSYPNLDYLLQTQLYRPGKKNIETDFSSGYWSTSIDFLLAAGYSFFPCHYENEGYLFRGMQTGLGQSLTAGRFGYFDGDDEMCSVEQAMDICFLTNEISDAVTVSRLYDSSADAAILAIKASVFHSYLNDGKAAVLAIGDGGIVFRYPFLTNSLSEKDVTWIFTTDKRVNRQSTAGLSDRIITLQGDNRKILEAELKALMQNLGIRQATPSRTDHYPGRQKNAGRTSVKEKTQ